MKPFYSHPMMPAAKYELHYCIPDFFRSQKVKTFVCPVNQGEMQSKLGGGSLNETETDSKRIKKCLYINVLNFGKIHSYLLLFQKKRL